MSKFYVILLFSLAIFLFSSCRTSGLLGTRLPNVIGDRWGIGFFHGLESHRLKWESNLDVSRSLNQLCRMTGVNGENTYSFERQAPKRVELELPETITSAYEQGNIVSVSSLLKHMAAKKGTNSQFMTAALNSLLTSILQAKRTIEPIATCDILWSLSRFDFKMGNPTLRPTCLALIQRFLDDSDSIDERMFTKGIGGIGRLGVKFTLLEPAMQIQLQTAALKVLNRQIDSQGVANIVYRYAKLLPDNWSTVILM